jgi:L-lactate dehydrogenase (cytochrome)/(S)-mandelate dehydrogenase
MANPFANARFRWSENTELLSVEDFRNAARRRLPHMVWAYVDGGAEDLLTLNANRDAFARWRFRPKTLAGHERFDLRTGVCGTELSMPVFLAPTAMSGLAHWTGELAGAKAAERAGTRMVLSTAASYTPEEIAEATAEQHFFQLYPWAAS